MDLSLPCLLRMMANTLINLDKKEYTIKSMDNYRKTKEWRQHVMNTEEVAEVAKQIGMKKGA